jgi:hypothetical protein
MRTWPRELPDEHRGPWTEAGVFTGWGDFRLGACLDRHPSEWTLTVQIPFASLVVNRVR